MYVHKLEEIGKNLLPRLPFRNFALQLANLFTRTKIIIHETEDQQKNSCLRIIAHEPHLLSVSHHCAIESNTHLPTQITDVILRV